MKKGINSKDLFGVTQEELSMLLKITRSQLSMFELGKRDLPLAAKLQFIAMLKHVDEITSKSEANLPHIKAQETKRKKC